MISVLRVDISPISGFLLGDAGEYDPRSGGGYTVAETLIVPTPSTLAGMVLAQLGLWREKTVSSWEELVGSYEEMLDEAGIRWLRGPIISVGDRIVVPVYRCKRNIFVTRNDLAKALQWTISCISDKELEDMYWGKGEKIEPIKFYTISETTRIALETRNSSNPQKKVKEGYLFNVKRVSYSDNIKISIEIEAEDKADEIQQQLKGIARLAGKSSLAYIDTRHEERESYKGSYAVLLSPLPLPNELELEKLDAWGIVISRGLGYSLALRRRKPHVRMLLEGSIIRLPNSVESNGSGISLLETLKQKFDIETWPRDFHVLARLGYGSHILVDVM